MVKINMIDNCDFLIDLKEGSKCGNMPKALWNLAICKGQVKLFSQGIKPSRHWRLKDVKKYFGLSGGTNSILAQLEQLDRVLTGGK